MFQRFSNMFSKSSPSLLRQEWQLQYSPTTWGTLRKQFTKPLEQVAAPPSTFSNDVARSDYLLASSAVVIGCFFSTKCINVPFREIKPFLQPGNKLKSGLHTKGPLAQSLLPASFLYFDLFLRACVRQHWGLIQ